MESLIHQKTLSTCVFWGKKFNWSFPVIFISRKHSRTPMVVQWLGLYTSTAKGVGSIPGWGTKIPCAVGSQKKKKERKEESICLVSYVVSSWWIPPGNPQISELLCYPHILHELLNQAKFITNKVIDPEQDWTYKQRNRKLYQHSAGRGSV